MRNHLDLAGNIELEGSKSLLNRVLIISSYLSKSIKIHNLSSCNDVSTMLENLKILGLEFTMTEDSIVVEPPKKLNKKGKLNIVDSGTAYRFLLARTAAIQRSRYQITVSEQLKRRPVEVLFEVLKKMGISISEKNGALLLKGTAIKGGTIDLPADISSQFISALLLIAPSYNEDLEIFLDGEIVSRGYIDMTIKVMQDFGVVVDFDGRRLFVQKDQEYNNLSEYFIEPDYSSACYFWAIGALSRSSISTEFQTSSLQPDHQVAGILEKMGAIINVKNDKIYVKRGTLKGIAIDMRELPDQVPTIAVLALFANSKTVISNIEHLRFKESDRIRALVSELTKIGVGISFKNNSLIINPIKQIPGSIAMKTYNDHRLVMAFTILKLIFPQLSINNATSVEKSYPNFFNDIKSITSSSL